MRWGENSVLRYLSEESIWVSSTVSSLMTSEFSTSVASLWSKWRVLQQRLISGHSQMGASPSHLPNSSGLVCHSIDKTPMLPITSNSYSTRWRPRIPLSTPHSTYALALLSCAVPVCLTMSTISLTHPTSSILPTCCLQGLVQISRFAHLPTTLSTSMLSALVASSNQDFSSIASASD